MEQVNEITSIDIVRSIIAQRFIGWDIFIHMPHDNDFQPRFFSQFFSLLTNILARAQEIAEYIWLSRNLFFRPGCKLQPLLPSKQHGRIGHNLCLSRRKRFHDFLCLLLPNTDLVQTLQITPCSPSLNSRNARDTIASCIRELWHRIVHKIQVPIIAVEPIRTPHLVTSNKARIIFPAACTKSLVPRIHFKKRDKFLFLERIRSLFPDELIGPIIRIFLPVCLTLPAVLKNLQSPTKQKTWTDFYPIPPAPLFSIFDKC